MHALCSRYPRLFGLILLAGITCGAFLVLLVIGKAYFWGFSGDLAVAPGLYSLVDAGADVLMRIATALVLLVIAILFVCCFVSTSLFVLIFGALIVILGGADTWERTCDQLSFVYSICSEVVSAVLWSVVIIYTVFELPKIIRPTCLKLGLWLASKMA